MAAFIIEFKDACCASALSFILHKRGAFHSRTGNTLTFLSEHAPTARRVLYESGWPVSSGFLDEALRPDIASSLQASLGDLAGFDKWTEREWRGLASKVSANRSQRFRSVLVNLFHPLFRYLVEHPGKTFPFFMDNDSVWSTSDDDQRSFEADRFKSSGRRKTYPVISAANATKMLKDDGWIEVEVTDKGDVAMPSDALLSVLRFVQRNGVDVGLPESKSADHGTDELPSDLDQAFPDDDSKASDELPTDLPTEEPKKELKKALKKAPAELPDELPGEEGEPEPDVDPIEIVRSLARINKEEPPLKKPLK